MLPARRFLLVLGIVLIALNLRPSLTAVGPLVSFIRTDTALSNAALGLLTTLPLVTFALVSPLAPRLARRWGIEATLMMSLALLVAGILWRSVDAGTALYGGTLLLGVAITFGNVLLPGLVKRDFAASSGALTSLYAGAMGVGAAFGAGVSVPLAVSLGLGWRGALAAWAAPAAVAALAWWPALKEGGRRPRHAASPLRATRRLAASALAWQVALYWGLQSLLFYVLAAWMPELLRRIGLSAAEAGWSFSLMLAISVFGTLAVPPLAVRRADQRLLAGVVGGLCGLGILGLLSGSLIFVVPTLICLGLGLGACLGLALLFLVLRTRDSDASTQLSGMAQSVGYLVAAAGPAAIGAVHDATGGWTLPLWLLLAICGGIVATGVGAGRDITVE